VRSSTRTTTATPPSDAAEGDELLIPLSDDPAVLGKLWGMVLLLAVRDHAASVHYHPWRADDGLAYVVQGVRYALVPPPAELAGPVVAVARSLFTRRGRGRWLGRGSSGPACGPVELDVWGHVFVWDAVVWSSGGREGVELFRIAPAAAEQRHAEPGAAADRRGT
jgi:hypothetical protein